MRYEYPDDIPELHNANGPEGDASEVKTPEDEILEKYGAEELAKRVEKEKFISVDAIPVGNTVTIRTANTTYKLERRSDGFYMSGSPKYCPEPTKVSINGCTWGGSMLMTGVIKEGMKLEFNIPNRPKPTITTSVIESISDDGAMSIAA